MPNLAKLIAKNLVRYGGKTIGIKSCTLIKVAQGVRTVGAISAGTNPTETSHKAKGFIAEYSDWQIDGTLVKRSDRKIVLLGATIAAKQVPKPGDKITIADPSGVVATYRIVPDGVKGDPVGATYTCQGRA